MIDDRDGQPFNVLFNRARRTERDLSELLGLAKGMLADGVVTEDEAQYLRAWGENHPDALTVWPMRPLFERLQRHFVDGQIDEAERADLQTLLAALVGGTASLVLGYEAATTLPLDTPAPAIAWGSDQVYVFTGRFAYGTRSDVEREATSRESTCEQKVTRRTTCLVIGSFSSRDWAHSSYGRKIQKAVDLRDSGSALRIVGEDHWVTGLSQAACATGLAGPQTVAMAYDPAAPPPGEITQTVQAALAPHTAALQALGWHVEVTEHRISLHRFFKNGKLRKGHDVTMGFNEFVEDAFVDDDGLVQMVPRPSQRPYYVSSASLSTRTFVGLAGALSLFLEEARKLAPTGVTEIA